jgi:predicted FMN-binding regulatory protein PaiB
VVANLSRAVVAFEIPIARLEGKRMPGQNGTATDAPGLPFAGLPHT